MVVKFVCLFALIAFVHCAPQFQSDHELKHPIQPKPKSPVVSERFHQDPNLEYNFE